MIGPGTLMCHELFVLSQAGRGSEGGIKICDTKKPKSHGILSKITECYVNDS